MGQISRGRGGGSLVPEVSAPVTWTGAVTIVSDGKDEEEAIQGLLEGEGDCFQ